MPILGRAGVGPISQQSSYLQIAAPRTDLVSRLINSRYITTSTVVLPGDTTDPAPSWPQAYGTLTAKPTWTNTAAASGPMDQPPVSTRSRTLTLPNAPADGADIFAAWTAYFGNRSGTAGTKQAGDRVLIPGGTFTYSDNLEIPPSANDVEIVFGTEGSPTTLRSSQMSSGLVTQHAIRNYGTNIRIRGISQTSPLLIETTGVVGRNGLNQQGNTCLLLDPGSTDTYVQDVILRGARAAGFFSYNSTRYWLNRVTVEDSLADGYHNTNGSSYGLFTDCVSRRAGDDGWAVVYYDGDSLASQSHHMEVYRLFVDTNGHGRGFADIGCTDIVADQVVIRGSAAAGVIIDREATTRSGDHGSISNVLLQRFRMEGCNWSEQDHGSVFLRNGISNGTVTGVVMESFEIRDNPGHRQAIRTIGDGTTNTVLECTLSNFRFTGGTNTASGDQFGGNATSRITRTDHQTINSTPGVETVRPTLVINTPGRNATVTGVMSGSTTDTSAMRNTQAIQFYAGDGGTKISGTNVLDVQSVEVKIGDTVIGTVAGTALDSAKRGSQTWDTTAFTNGPALLQLTTIDKAGQSRTVTRQVTVSNATPGTTPGMPQGGDTTPVTPTPTPSALLADTFTRTSTTTAGTADTGQVWQPTGTWGTDGSTLGSVSKGDGNWISADVGTTVQEFEAKQTAGGANAYPGLLLNVEGGGSWYRAEWDPSGVLGIQRAVNSAYTSLATSGAGVMGVGKTIRMKTEIGATSTLVTVFVDNVQVLQGTDTWSASGRPKPTGTSVGFRHGAAATVDIRWDDAYVNRVASAPATVVGTTATGTTSSPSGDARGAASVVGTTSTVSALAPAGAASGSSTATVVGTTATATASSPAPAGGQQIARVASISVDSNGTGGGSFAVPAGVTTAHLGILAIGTTGVSVDPTIAGWTRVIADPAGQNNSAVYVFVRLGGLAAGDTITVVFGNGNSAILTSAVWYDTGGRPVSIVGTPGTRNAVSSSQTVIPGLTTVEASQDIIVFAAERTLATGTAITAWSPQTPVQDHYFESTQTSAQNSVSHYFGHFTKATAGSTGDYTATYNAASANGAGGLFAVPAPQAAASASGTAVITGVTATGTAASPAGSATGASIATVTGATALASASAPAGAARATAAVVGTTGTATSSSQSGTASAGASIGGATATVTAASAPGAVTAGTSVTVIGATATAQGVAPTGAVTTIPPPIVGATGTSAASSSAGAPTSTATIVGSTASSTASSAPGSAVAVVSVTVTGSTATASTAAAPGTAQGTARVNGVTGTAAATSAAGAAASAAVVTGTTSTSTASSTPGTARGLATVTGTTATSNANSSAGTSRANAVLVGVTATGAALAGAGTVSAEGRVIGTTAAASTASSAGQVSSAATTTGQTGTATATAPAGTTFVGTSVTVVGTTGQATATSAAGTPSSTVVVTGATAEADASTNPGDIGATRSAYINGTTFVITAGSGPGTPRGTATVQGATAPAAATSTSGVVRGGATVTGTTAVTSAASTPGTVNTATNVTVTGVTATAASMSAAGTAKASSTVTGATAAHLASSAPGTVSGSAVATGTSATASTTSAAGTVTSSARVVGVAATASARSNAGVAAARATAVGVTALATSTSTPGDVRAAGHVPGTTATANASSSPGTATGIDSTLPIDVSITIDTVSMGIPLTLTVRGDSLTIEEVWL